MDTPGSGRTLRFGDFELDEAAYALRRSGRPVRLQRQSMDLLILLVGRRGQLVSRKEIVDHLWAKDVFVDVETGVNTAISKIRQALRDSADAPAFLETVPGKGYRFIAAVEVIPSARPSSVGAPQNTAVLAAASSGDHASAANDPILPDPLPELADAGSAIAPAGSRAHWITPQRVGIGLLAIVVALGVVGLAKLRDGGPASSATLAVLPFRNLGSDPERDYLAAGLTDETSASLAQIDPDRLSIKGRSVQYTGTTKTAAEIGRELSVDYLVDSSIRAEGSRLRVTVTLIRVKDQEHLWSQSYDREPTSLLGWQQELSAAIARQIKLRLTPDRLSGLERRQTQSVEAYDAYLRGRDQAHRRTADGNIRAIALLTRAVAIDKDYALAWSDLAIAYAGGTVNGDAPPAMVGPPAHDAAANAVRANSGLSEAQMALGYGLWLIDWDWAAARRALQLAVDLDPSNASAYRLLGHALSQAGRHREAESAMHRSRELDPLDALTHALSAQTAFQARDAAAARDHARRAILIDPNLWIGYIQLAQAYEGAGDHALALEAVADAERLAAGNSKVPSMKGYVLARLGRKDAAREVVLALEATSRERYVPPYAMALVYAGLGDRDAVFRYLEEAYAVRDIHLMYLPVDMKWDPYRSDPRFVGLVARCGFSTAQ